MSCGCCDAKPKQRKQVCPDCGDSALAVGRQTLLHQLQFPDNQHLVEGDYAFCSNRDCAVGYFSSSVRIAKNCMRAFKPEQPAMLCYCFDISESMYRMALEQGKASKIKDFIVQQTRDQLCACECRNPSGRCCLANVKRMEASHES